MYSNVFVLEKKLKWALKGYQSIDFLSFHMKIRLPKLLIGGADEWVGAIGMDGRVGNVEKDGWTGKDGRMEM